MLRRDIREAVRITCRDIGLLFLVSILLAAGIGVNSAVLELADETVWKKLPFADATRVFMLEPLGEDGKRKPVTTSMYEQIQAVVWRKARVFAWNQDVAQAVLGGTPRLLNALSITPNAFSILSIRSVRGRMLTYQDRSSACLITDRFWKTAFNRDSQIIGKQLWINGLPTTVIGILDPSFTGLIANFPPDLVFPLSIANGKLASYADLSIRVAGQLSATTPVQAVEKALNDFWPQIVMAARPASIPAERWRNVVAAKVKILDGAYGVNRLRDTLSTPVKIVLLMAMCLFVCTMATFGTIIATRTYARRDDYQIRLALGAPIHLVARLVAIEGIILATPGVLLSVVVAFLFGQLAIRLFPPSNLPRVIDIAVLGPGTIRSIAVAIAVVLLASFFSVAVILSSTRASRRPSRFVTSGTRVRMVLLAVQVGFAVFFLVPTGLFGRTLTLLQNEDVGVVSDRLHIFALMSRRGAPGIPDYEYFREVLAEVRALPGVQSAGWMDGWLFLPADPNVPVTQADATGLHEAQARLHCMSSGLLETLGARILGGRDFTEGDTRDHPIVAIASIDLARKLVSTESAPYGDARILDGDRFSAIHLVGIASNVKHGGAREQESLDLYMPCEQRLRPAQMLDQASLFVRFRNEKPGLSESVRRTIESIGHQVVAKEDAAASRLYGSLYSERFLTYLGSILGSIELWIAALGAFSITTMIIRTQFRELAIRIAVGANIATLMQRFFRKLSFAVGVGALVGATVALGGVRVYQGTLFLATFRCKMACFDGALPLPASFI